MSQKCSSKKCSCEKCHSTHEEPTNAAEVHDSESSDSKTISQTGELEPVLFIKSVLLLVSPALQLVYLFYSKTYSPLLLKSSDSDSKTISPLGEWLESFIVKLP